MENPITVPPGLFALGPSQREEVKIHLRVRKKQVAIESEPEQDGEPSSRGFLQTEMMHEAKLCPHGVTSLAATKRQQAIVAAAHQ